MLPSGLLATRALDLKGAVRRAPGDREGLARPALPPGGDSGEDAGPEGAGGADQPKGVQCGRVGATAGGPGRAHCGLPTPLCLALRAQNWSCSQHPAHDPTAPIPAAALRATGCCVTFPGLHMSALMVPFDTQRCP